MPMPEPPYTVLHQEQDARWNPDATITRLIRVRFMVGKYGPFTEEFEQDKFSAVERDRRLRELAREYWVEPAPGR